MHCQDSLLSKIYIRSKPQIPVELQSRHFYGDFVLGTSRKERRAQITMHRDYRCRQKAMPAENKSKRKIQEVAEFRASAALRGWNGFGSDGHKDAINGEGPRLFLSAHRGGGSIIAQMESAFVGCLRTSGPRYLPKRR